MTLGLLALACTDEITVLSPDQQAPAIDVSGSGTASAAPDVAVLSLGVEAEADSVGEARAQAAEAMDAHFDFVLREFSQYRTRAGET